MFEKLNLSQKAWVEKTYAEMTEDERIGQLVNELSNTFMSKGKDAAAYLKKYPIGSVFTGSEIIDAFAADGERTKRLNTVLEEANLKIPVILSGDFENGIGGQIKGYTAMPRTMGLSATFSEEDSYDFGKVIGTEAQALNIRWGFGPVSDLNINRENPVTNIRSASDEPDHAIKILKNIVKGMQDYGCAACPKHFPGDGTDTRNQHYVTSHNVLSKEEWDKLHGRVFKELIDAGAMSIMIGHIAFPAYEGPDPEREGLYRPATASRRIMTDLLRGELGFRGIILTDALCMNGFISWGDYEKRILDSFNGGTDVFLWPGPEKFFPLMKEALKDGRASRERLEESVKRVLAFKVLLGVTPCEDMGFIRETRDLNTLLKDNKVIAERIAENSITLLRNRDNVLPLKLEKDARVLLLYAPEKEAPRQHLSVFADELKARGCQVTMTPFSNFHVLEPNIDIFDCVMLLSDANPQYSEYRGFDNGLWPFLACNRMKKRICISFATPYFLYDVAGEGTYINSYHDCEASVKATVKAMFGEIPFRGRCPVSVPNCFSFGEGKTL